MSVYHQTNTLLSERKVDALTMCRDAQFNTHWKIVWSSRRRIVPECFSGCNDGTRSLRSYRAPAQEYPAMKGRTNFENFKERYNL